MRTHFSPTRVSENQKETHFCGKEKDNHSTPTEFRTESYEGSEFDPITKYISKSFLYLLRRSEDIIPFLCPPNDS